MVGDGCELFVDSAGKYVLTVDNPSPDEMMFFLSRTKFGFKAAMELEHAFRDFSNLKIQAVGIER